MIDINLIRKNPQIAKASQIARGANPDLIDDAIKADDERKKCLTIFEEKRSKQKELSRNISKCSPDERAKLLQEAKILAEEVKKAEALANKKAEEATKILASIDNIILEDVPSGGEDDYVVLKHVGKIRDFKAEGVEIKDHLDLAEGIKAVDVKRGAKVSGARFYYLTGIGARLELALLTMAYDQAIEAGFTPMVTPTLVTPQIMSGTGFLGEHSAEIYYLPTDDLYLTGTSEVALAGYHANEIIDLSDGSNRYAGWSTCYRREAGSHGKDTRGIIRVHQFNKIEMFSYCKPEQAQEEHARLLGWEEEMLAKVELPYRVIDTAAGDLGSSAARKFDCEAWLPSQNRWMEVTSTSNCTTFQARRLNIRERSENGTSFVATLNGTLATTRWLVAILENHQQADGSIYVPKAMRKYLGGLEYLLPEK